MSCLHVWTIIYKIISLVLLTRSYQVFICNPTCPTWQVMLSHSHWTRIEASLKLLGSPRTGFYRSLVICARACLLFSPALLTIDSRGISVFCLPSLLSCRRITRLQVLYWPTLRSSWMSARQMNTTPTTFRTQSAGLSPTFRTSSSKQTGKRLDRS